MEAIRKITQTEEQMRQRKADAQQQADRMCQTARTSGESLLEQVRLACEEKAKELLEQAEQQAREQQKSMEQETARACAQLRREGEVRWQEAVDYIVKSVVKG